MSTLEHLHAIRNEAEKIYDEQKVAAAYDRLAAQITADYQDKNPIILAVMVGGLVPAAELSKRFSFLYELDYVHATRYRGATQGGEIQWMATPSIPLAGRHVLIIDDILDEGYTLSRIIESCEAQGVKSVKTAVLINKVHDRRYNNMRADYEGLRVEDRYVFGCGMDYKGYFRGVPEIYAIK